MKNTINKIKNMHLKYYSSEKKELYCSILISCGMILILAGYYTFKPSKPIVIDPFKSEIVLSCFKDATKKYEENNTMPNWNNEIVDRNNTKFVLNDISYNMYISDYNYCISRVKF